MFGEKIWEDKSTVLKMRFMRRRYMIRPEMAKYTINTRMREVMRSLSAWYMGWSVVVA